MQPETGVVPDDVSANDQFLAVGIHAVIKLNVAAVEFDQVVFDDAAPLIVHGDAHRLIVMHPAIAHHIVIAAHLDAVVARALDLESIHGHPVAIVAVADDVKRSADDNGLPFDLGLDRRGRSSETTARATLS